ncbi:pyrroline-5-carboxylate reductase [Wenzhouxiangella limi]|uniref:Pyrroline-5-carboxylate reductase n=1 Tax=Wenzhouxiangella limi TaxID=2707351 RepID=A0A845V5R6_9GAMM|nr:pyrroline-5-carboxylate reductase [Wenzhouxiangella limi]NDY95541.1 pyrroline-5-carboxylate reductase [Wenzhouxiangella limi]
MNSISIAFIGGGNMARALIGGLCRGGHPPAAIHVAEPAAAARERLAADHGVQVTSNNSHAAAGAEVIVLAVKPQVMDGVLRELRSALQPGALVISVAAGVTLASLRRGLGDAARLVRAMPNTPALFGAGMTGLVAADGVEPDDRARADRVLESAGETVWLDDEALMDVVTAVSGSGPAYFFALAEQLALAGERAGLAPAVAAKLARQTAFGAGTMLSRAEQSAGQLREQVTSPGGTTEAALTALSAGGFEDLIEQAVSAAVRRGRELGED